MTRKLAGGIAAGAFALGAFVAAAGTALGQDPGPPTDAMTEHMATMSDQMAGMSDHMKGTDMAQMMGMMDGAPGMPMMPGASGGPMPRPSGMPPAEHDAHHAWPAPEGTR